MASSAYPRRERTAPSLMCPGAGQLTLPQEEAQKSREENTKGPSAKRSGDDAQQSKRKRPRLKGPAPPALLVRPGFFADSDDDEGEDVIRQVIRQKDPLMFDVEDTVVAAPAVPEWVAGAEPGCKPIPLLGEKAMNTGANNFTAGW